MKNLDQALWDENRLTFTPNTEHRTKATPRIVWGRRRTPSILEIPCAAKNTSAFHRATHKKAHASAGFLVLISLDRHQARMIIHRDIQIPMAYFATLPGGHDESAFMHQPPGRTASPWHRQTPWPSQQNPARSREQRRQYFPACDPAGSLTEHPGIESPNSKKSAGEP